MRPFIALAVMLMPALGAAGCGKRGDPLPPLQRIPVQVDRPRVSQQGHEIVVVWQTPTATLDGGTLELEAAEVLRRVVEPPPGAATPLPSEAPEETTSEAVSGESTRPPEAARNAPADGPGDDERDDDVRARESVDASPGDEQEGERTEDATELGGASDPAEQTGPTTPRLAVSSSHRPASFASEAKVIARIECHEPGERLEYRDPLDPEWEGMRVEYAIRHVNRNGRRSETSSRRTIEPLAPLPAPSELKVAPDNGFVRLTWGGGLEPGARAAEHVPQPNERAAAEGVTETEPDLEDAGKVELDFGFNVYRRRKTASSYPLQALNRQLLESASFEDRNVVFGREWCYTVRRVAVRRTPEPTDLPPDDSADFLDGSERPAEASMPENRQARRGRAANARRGGREGRSTPAAEPPALIESAGAPDVCLTPIDTFAPAAPKELVALGVPGGILLSWDESDAADLEGYRVYRAERRNGPFEPLDANLVKVPSFTDPELTAGKTYFYAVSAVDDAQPPNESPRSEVVDAQALE